MVINHNLSAMNAHRNMGVNNSNKAKSIEKLSSGLRINRAGDDAAGLSISEKMRGQIRGLQQATRNAQDGVSLIQTAEGALGESQSILQRMRELAVQATNGSNQDADRDMITKEFSQLQDEMTRIAGDSEFNKKKLLDGSMGGGRLGAATTAKIQASSYTMQTSAAKLGGSAAKSNASGQIKMASATRKLASADTLMGQYDGMITLAKSLSPVSAAKKLASAALKLGSANIKKTSAAIKTASAEIKFASAAAKTAKQNIKTQSAAVKMASAGTGVKFQIGANSGQVIDLSIDDMRATALGVNKAAVSIDDDVKASHAITEIDKALTKISDQRASLGAAQNRLEHTIDSDNNAAENLQAAESRIRDVDMAAEMMKYTKSNILAQAAQAMLGQANSAPNSVLNLLQQ